MQAGKTIFFITLLFGLTLFLFGTAQAAPIDLNTFGTDSDSQIVGSVAVMEVTYAAPLAASSSTRLRALKWCLALRPAE